MDTMKILKAGADNGKLPVVDRFLTLWIFLAMAAGVALGFFFPGFSKAVSDMKAGATSIPIAIGLILMMYPPLTKVKYEGIGRAFGNKKVLALSLVQNWVIGPLLMFGLAVLFLRGHPGYMIGIILVGLARCIAMVIVWNDLAKGDRELGVGLVALNAVFQVLMYSGYIFLFITVIMGVLGIKGDKKDDISFWDAAKTVLFYLGIPFLAGLVSRYGLIALKGKEWFDAKFAPRIGKLTLIALLFTIVAMFSIQGGEIIRKPLDVLLIAAPLGVYFLVMWLATFFLARLAGADYEKSAAVSFSAASNDFELAIAVAIVLYGMKSQEAFATVIGPLIEVPVMVSLVSFSLWLKKKFFNAVKNN